VLLYYTFNIRICGISIRISGIVYCLNTTSIEAFVCNITILHVYYYLIVVTKHVISSYKMNFCVDSTGSQQNILREGAKHIFHYP